MLKRVVLWILLAACGASQRSGGEPVDPMERIRAECDGLEHDEQAKCMDQKQLQAMRDREHEDIQRKQPTADKTCGEDATLSESTTDEGNRRHIEYVQCVAQQRMEAQRAREQQAEEQEQMRAQRAREQQAEEQEQMRAQREREQQAEEQERQDDQRRLDAARQLDGVVLNARIAQCQAKIDSDNDLAGAAACWMQIHDQVDPQDVNKPADVQACLDGVAEDLRAVQACVALPEKSDDEIIAKADCVAQRVRNARDPRTNVARSRTPLAAMRPDNTCGDFSLVKYVDHHLGAAKIDEEAARIDAKAKDLRARVAVRESVCKALNVIEFEQRQLDQERAIERESGVEDLGRRREIGSTLVLFKQQYQAALTDYQRVWKRSFSRPRDCVKRPSLRGVVKLGASVKDKVRDGAAIEVSLHVPGMGDAGSKRLLWRGDAVAFEFEKVATMGLKIVGGDVEIRARCLGGSCGDIRGAVTVKVPADHIEVVLNVVPRSEAEPVDQLPQSSP